MSIPQAVRHVRRALGLKQSELAERIFVARETISAWERGRREPTHEQRVLTVARLAAAPAQVVMPLVQAFGIAPPAPLRPSGNALVAERLSAALRAAADELDVQASSLRRTLKAVIPRFAATGVSLEDLAEFLSST